MIEIEERGVVAIVRMAAGKGNALNVEFASAFIDTLAQIEGGPAKAAILTGKGSVLGRESICPPSSRAAPIMCVDFFPSCSTL